MQSALRGASEQLPGYSFLRAGEWVQPNGSFALTGAVANIFEALQHGAPLSSKGSNALQSQALCEQMKQMALAHASGPVLKKETL